MSLVATSDPILAVLKPYQALYNSDHWLWGNLVTRLGFVLGISLLIKVWCRRV